MVNLRRTSIHIYTHGWNLGCSRGKSFLWLLFSAGQPCAVIQFCLKLGEFVMLLWRWRWWWCWWFWGDARVFMGILAVTASYLYVVQPLNLYRFPRNYCILQSHFLFLLHYLTCRLALVSSENTHWCTYSHIHTLSPPSWVSLFPSFIS